MLLHMGRGRGHILFSVILCSTESDEMNTRGA